MRAGRLRWPSLLACGLLLAASRAPAHEEIEELVVRERSDSLVGTADAASQGTVGADQLEQRTLSRPGEVLETVPGVIITQHSGAGKANQFFLRGFNLDHGTDFATSIDGVPVNQPSHGHGQGYTDLNFLIPELIEGIDFRKGVYDARDVNDAVDPADPLVRTTGAEVGVRTALVPGLQSTVSLWWLDLDSELVFVGDAGTTEATRESRRLGIELANYYDPFSWLTLDADVSLSRARFRDSDPAGDHIPGAVETVVAAGATVHDLGGPFGTIRLRYFGPRPLIEDGSVESDHTVLLSAKVGYEFNETWTIAAEVFNLLDRSDHEIDYFYESRLLDEPAGLEDIHFHPVDPISFRVALTAKF